MPSIMQYEYLLRLGQRHPHPTKYKLPIAALHVQFFSLVYFLARRQFNICHETCLQGEPTLGSHGPASHLVMFLNLVR